MQVERSGLWPAVRRLPAPRYSYAAAGLAALAALVAADHLTAKSLWLDETVSADHSRLGLIGILKVISGNDPNMGLYYALLYVWVRIFGYGEAAIRSLSVLAGSVAVVGMVALGRRLFGSATGLIAGLLLALAPFYVDYEQTARSYALLVALLIWSSYFFVGELEQPSRGSRIGHVLTSTLAVYADYVAPWVLLVQLVTLVAVKRRAALERRWLAAWGAIALLCVPEVLAAIHHGSVWFGWIHRPSLSDLAHMPATLMGGGVLYYGLVLLGVCGLLSARSAQRRWRLGFAAAWFVLPIMLVFVFSLLVQPLFLSRYLIVAVPGIVMLAAAGLIWLRSHALSAAALAVVVAFGIADASSLAHAWPIDDFRGATEHVLARQRAGDGILYEPSWGQLGFQYYLQLRHVPGPTTLALDPKQLAGTRRVWVVFRDTDTSPGAERAAEAVLLRDHVQLGPPASFANITVLLYGPRTA